MATGAFGHIGLGKETAWGTPVAATDYVPFISESLVHEIEQIMENVIWINRHEPPQYAGLETVKGDIVAEARPGALGYFLRSCFGPPSTSGTGPYVHVFLPASGAFLTNCALPPYTLEIHRDLASAFQFAGCVVDKLTLEFGVKQKILKLTASVMGKDVALITKTTPSFETAAPWLWDQAAIKIAGVDNANLEDVSLSIENNLEGVALLNQTRKIGSIRFNGHLVGNLNLTFDVPNLDEYNRFKNQTEVALEVTLTSGTNVLKLESSKTRYTAFPLNIGGPGRISVSASAKLKYDSTLGGLIKVTLTNDKASY